jgi:putative RNA 2'-phosphotransferase
MLSYALRHNPYKYNLEVDGEGWTSINKLLIALSSDHYNNDERMNDHIITRQEIEEIIACSNKVRFELRDDKIRALYGHSNTFTKMNKIPSNLCLLIQ